MICVAISSNDVQNAIDKSKKAIEKGADLIEVRIDHFSNPFEGDFEHMVEKIDSKLILTVRKADEGGNYPFNEEERLKLIDKCIKAKPYAIDLESSISKEKLNQLLQFAKQNQVKIIISFHDFEKTPEINLMKNTILEAVQHGADYVKIIGTAQTVEDNLKMLTLPQFAREKNIQIICFAMGRKGSISRILSPIFGAAFTFASLDEATGPGQLNIDEMKKNLETFTSYFIN